MDERFASPVGIEHLAAVSNLLMFCFRDKEIQISGLAIEDALIILNHFVRNCSGLLQQKESGYFSQSTNPALMKTLGDMDSIRKCVELLAAMQQKRVQNERAMVKSKLNYLKRWCVWH